VVDESPDPGRIATQQDFGRELTALRTRARLTVRQVARATGLPVSTVADYFSGGTCRLTVGRNSCSESWKPAVRPTAPSWVGG
jgi:hypothetical protein